MKRLQLHPACKLFPQLPDDELEQLADDIRANGLRNRIVLLDGQILDGRNRAAACEMAGVKPQFTEWDRQGSPIEWVISQNLVRRHLSASQRAVIAHADPIQQQAAADTNAVQDAVNLVAVVGCFHRHLLALHRSGVCGDDLINHPVSLAFVSKLNSLCRMTLDREIAAFETIDRIQTGEAVEYEVIPL